MITLCCILSAHKASQFAGRQLGGSKILLVVGGHMLSGTWLVCNCLLQVIVIPEKARYKQSTFKDLQDDGHLQVKINCDDHLQVTIITIF